MRILFILKFRQVYSGGYTTDFPSGLLNSALLVSDMLNSQGFVSKVVEVVDNNSIDKEVHDFNPDVVIIEALWVVPEKFAILKQLHPNVKWVVRIHSEMPFLAQEGIAIQWIKQYAAIPDVYVGTNSIRCFGDLSSIVDPNKLLLLPNFYPTLKKLPGAAKHTGLDIACFGAIRPFKDQLMQAVAAIKYAEQAGEIIRFHVNSSRVEDGSEVLKNLRALFAGTEHTLVENTWMDRPTFLALLATMDLSMTVSFTETFCIVAADSVSVGVPLVTSPEVPWSIKDLQASPTNSKDIVNKISKALGWKSSIFNFMDRRSLQKYSSNSRAAWIKELKGL
jgi:hypothetical protein